MKDLAIVTGGSRGIGKAISEALMDVGFDVYFTYKSDHIAANEFTLKNKNKCEGFCVDGSDYDCVKNFSDFIYKEKGRMPAVLINNSGINADSLFMNQDMDVFWDIMHTNLGSVLNYSKVFIDCMMKRKDGHIINISSIASVKPKIGNAAYGVSKASIERFSKTLALEVAPFNVKVNCISPAYVETDMFQSFIKKQRSNEFYRNIPMRKILQPCDVASMVKNLCINEIKTTGSVFYIGNGENISI